jgi:hypothetical protein
MPFSTTTKKTTHRRIWKTISHAYRQQPPQTLWSDSQGTRRLTCSHHNRGRSFVLLVIRRQEGGWWRNRRCRVPYRHDVGLGRLRSRRRFRPRQLESLKLLLAASPSPRRWCKRLHRGQKTHPAHFIWGLLNLPATRSRLNKWNRRPCLTSHRSLESGGGGRDETVCPRPTDVKGWTRLMQHLQQCDVTEMKHGHGGGGTEKERYESVLQTTLHGERMWGGGKESGEGWMESAWASVQRANQQELASKNVKLVAMTG